jgi:basic amino acid/polyamine antiporter, APA family
MARDGLFPQALAAYDTYRGTTPLLTLLQVVLACGYVAVGTFDQILGYFVPSAVFFLGLSAAATLRLPRPTGPDVFRAPFHPVPLLLFLTLVAVVLGLFVVGQPTQTLLGAALVLVGALVSLFALPRRQRHP